MNNECRPETEVDSITCPQCGYPHARRQAREDYSPPLEVVFCNGCGKVSVHELQPDTESIKVYVQKF